jgi:vancomycin resistance protein YoaR
MFKKTKIIIFPLVGILLISALALKLNPHDNLLVRNGVIISGINVGGLTKEKAQEKVNAEVETWLSQVVKFETNGEVTEVPLKDLEPSIDIEAPLNEAYNLGREGSIINIALSKVKASEEAHIDLVLNWEDAKLTENLMSHLDQYNIEPVDASYRINEQNLMEIQADQSGQIIDIGPLVEQIKNTKIFQDPGTLQLHFKDEQPHISATNLESQKIDGLLGSYTTWFDASLTERTENVRIAAKALDGALIPPGETISFNDIVGQRTGEKGYLEAYIIENGVFVPGLGGGICQVSSTLYNAGLLANLKVEERANHDLAIAYVPLGRDATVVYSALDLKLNNDTGAYLLIRTRIVQNALTIELYGKVKPGQEVLISSKVESTIPYTEQRIQDNSIAPGKQVIKQQGQPGYIASASRTVKLNGNIIKTEDLGKSQYRAVPQITAIGPAVPPAPPAPPPAPPVPSTEAPPGNPAPEAPLEDPVPEAPPENPAPAVPLEQ